MTWEPENDIEFAAEFRDRSDQTEAFDALVKAYEYLGEENRRLHLANRSMRWAIGFTVICFLTVVVWEWLR